ncbi:hypothetical protein N9V07_03230 [Candidatus Pelagibacter sp.]|nr:hypothetical protein [Candidatus Pelagibacter sp.]|tara:strand:+ start:337 stop:561 length:225 start_codon:yes stop_codon:yes gene_type:complete
MIAGIALYFILKVLGIIFGICCFVWCFFKLVGADKEADDVEDFGGKIVDIFGVIIKYLFFAIVALIIYIISVVT